MVKANKTSYELRKEWLAKHFQEASVLGFVCNLYPRFEPDTDRETGEQ